MMFRKRVVAGAGKENISVKNKMGFFITSEFEEKSSGLSAQNFYVNIRNFSCEWRMDGEVKKYFLTSLCNIHVAAGKKPLHSFSFRFEVTKEQTEENIPAQIYSWLKTEYFAGHEFSDDL